MFAIISRDAGGAEIVSSFAKKQKEKFCLAISGPAINIFKKKIGKRKIYDRLTAIKKSDWVLCSTGTYNNFEKNGIILAKNNEKKVIAFLDHWVNYSERFKKGNKLNLPDEIWVGDKYALKIARKKKLKPVFLKKNPFFDDFKKKIVEYNNKKLKAKGTKKRIIFLSEPVSKNLRKYYSENQCIMFFLKNLSALKVKIGKITIRPHPAEKIEKFNWVKKISKKIFISKKKHIFNEIFENDIIIGINTVALVFALMAKKRVISCIPNNKVKCDLPHKGIIEFKKLL